MGFKTSLRIYIIGNKDKLTQPYLVQYSKFFVVQYV